VPVTNYADGEFDAFGGEKRRFWGISSKKSPELVEKSIDFV
jgi:hypothetical protein